MQYWQKYVVSICSNSGSHRHIRYEMRRLGLLYITNVKLMEENCPFKIVMIKYKVRAFFPQSHTSCMHQPLLKLGDTQLKHTKTLK